jgi:hypothetical protein
MASGAKRGLFRLKVMGTPKVARWRNGPSVEHKHRSVLLDGSGSSKVADEAINQHINRIDAAPCSRALFHLHRLMTGDRRPEDFSAV